MVHATTSRSVDWRVSFLLTGVLFVLAPAQGMSAVGWPATPNEALILARDGGVLMIGLALVDWMGRAAVGAPLRGLLWGNIVIRIGGGVVNSWEFAVGMIPPLARSRRRAHCRYRARNRVRAGPTLGVIAAVR